MTLSSKVLARTSLYLEKTAVLGSFGHIRPTFGIRMWPKLPKGTSTYQDLSFAPTPTSIRPSVTKKQPGKAHVSKNRCFRKFRPDSANFQYANVAENSKRHIYTPRPLICAYSQISTTARYKDTSWKRIDTGQTDGHPKCLWSNNSSGVQWKKAVTNIVMKLSKIDFSKPF